MSQNKITLGLVDDHRLFRKGLRAIFADTEDIEVILEASNGNELFELMKKEVPQALLLDLEMPGMDGKATLEILRRDFPEIKVVLLTMFKNEEFMLHFMKSGAHGFLLKDAHPEELEQAIRKVMQTGFYLSDTVSRVMLQRLEDFEQGTVGSTPGKIQLAERENEVLQLICQELTTAEIAEKLFLSPRTVETYRKRLLEKTGVRNTVGLVLYASKNGLIQETDPDQ